MAARPWEGYQLANDFLQGLRAEEADQTIRRVFARNITMADDGTVVIDGERYPLSPRAAQDLAAIARIPANYFAEIAPDLKAVNFNRRFPEFAPRDYPLSTVWNGNTVGRFDAQPLTRLPRAQAVEAVLDQAPADTDPNGIRVMPYWSDGGLDAAFITRALETEPRRGDVVFGGAHLTIETTGAVQVGPAFWRLACSNGAIVRICANGQHRVRRGLHKDKLAAAIRAFARESWGTWGRVAEGLRRLAQENLEAVDAGHLVQRLRQSPFFISAEAARRVRDALEAERGGQLTLYDWHNAITSVGTHADDLLHRYRYRLRLGAGALTQGRARLCKACRQWLMAA